jgi:hypothetical protein
LSNKDVGLRVTSALNYAHTGDDEELRPHYLWQVRQLTKELSADDLTTPELVAFIAVLIPAHSRLLSGRAASELEGVPFLRVIHDPTA